MDAVIKVENLSYSYKDGTQALKGLSLKIPRGSKVALLGPNGAGKSTLLFHVNGLYLPQKGKVKVLGQDVTKKNELLIKEKVGLVFQDPDDQIFAPTVWEDVAFGPLNLGLEPNRVKDQVTKALETVEMFQFKDKAPYHLSFGQKKRVSIAGVLAMNPEVIILDEPAAYLDPSGQEKLKMILDNLHQEGKTLVVVTHDVDMAAEWADYLIIIKDGCVLAEGGKELLYNEKIINEANLRLPIITQLFKKLDYKGDYPVTVNEAAKLLTKNLL